MFPLLSILIALTLGLSYRQMVPAGPPVDFTGAAATVLAFAVCGKVLMVLATRRAQAEQKVRPFFAASSQLRLLVVITYGAIIYMSHWPRVVDTLALQNWILVDELLVMAPFFVLLLISFHISWSGESSLSMHDFGLVEYVSFQTRQLLLPVAPIFFFLLVVDLIGTASRGGIEWVAMAQILANSYPFVQWICFGALLLALYCLIPFGMRYMWRLKPMPPGPVRDRLEEYSRRENFKAREILLWPTGGNILNAAVIGISARFRYVLMTDALINELELDEVEAVFAHEVGHAKHNHLLKFFFFILGYTLLMYLVLLNFEEPLERLIGGSVLGVMTFTLGGIFLWFGLLLGFVSRRFEQQADVHGAVSTGRDHENGEGPHPFVRALERIALQMGDIREMKGWRHFSLGSRIEFIERFVSDPKERLGYRKRMAGLLLFFFGLLGLIGLGAALTIPRQIRDGKVKAAVARAQWLEKQGRRAEALEILKEGGYLKQSPTMDREELRLLAMRQTDRASSVDVDFLERYEALWHAAHAYLALDMPGAARVCLEEILMMTVALDLPPDVKARLLELMGLSLAAQSHNRGAQLAYTDALSLLPEESPGAARLKAHLAGLESSPDPTRKR